MHGFRRVVLTMLATALSKACAAVAEVLDEAAAARFAGLALECAHVGSLGPGPSTRPCR